MDDKDNKIKEEGKTIGKIIDDLLNNPFLIMKQCNIVMEENKKLKEEIKERDKKIAFLNGEIEGLLYQIKK